MSYLTLNPRKLKNRIQKCVNILTPLKNNFDSIAFMGISGALVAPAVASELGKHLIAVRKEKPVILPITSRLDSRNQKTTLL
jgi:adenine/guanine phosphoribosyltransferase-like PRPP-binding protein